ncbi:MAG: hypothetical protein V3V53_15995, partial [Bacteroidales bacterium]
DPSAGETDPLNPDTDGDGINDGTESGLTAPETGDTDLSAGNFIPDDDPSTTTDPTNPDTDGDGMPDGWEVTNGLNPLVDDSGGDIDGDGTSNLQEYLDGTDPTIFNFSITNITQDWKVTDHITIEWESVSDLEYQIALKDDYMDAFSVVDAVTASGESTSWTDDGSMTGTHPSAVHQRYYKVIQDGVDSQNVVGMFRVTVQDGMNLISLPLIPFSTTLADCIGIQTTGADNEGASDRIWVWNGTNYEFAWQVGETGTDFDGQWFTGNIPTTITLGADQGAWVQIRPGYGPVDLYLLGEVSTTNRTIPVNVGMNLIGTSYPVPVLLTDNNLWESGLSGADNEGDADRIWSWDTDHNEFFWLVDGVNEQFDGQWFMGNDPVERSLEAGRGYWIERKEGRPTFDWNYLGP